MVVNMRLMAMLRINVPVRPMPVLQRCVVMLVGVIGRQVLPAPHAFLCIGSIVCDMHMFVVVVYRFMEVTFGEGSTWPPYADQPAG